MFYSLRVKAPIEDLLKAFEREASKRGFGVIHSYHLSDTLRAKGFQVPGELFLWRTHSDLHDKPSKGLRRAQRWALLSGGY